MGKKIGTCVFCEEEKPILARGLCAACYQRYRLRGSPEYVKIRKPCSIDGCDNLSVANKLCDMHYRRWKKHGSTKQTRPKGWGSKEKHPLYHTWHWQKRNEPKTVFADEWQDFWQFVEDVGERPSSKHRFCVIDTTKPVYKENFRWELWKDGGGSRERRTEYARQWRKDNPEKIKNSDLKKRFGISLDDYYKLLKQQNYVCEICGQGETAIDPRTKKAFDLAVDHDHKTGKVRSLLCKNCNNMLGYAKDSQEILTKAINYLKKHASSEA